MTTSESKDTIAIIMTVQNEAKFLGQTLDQIYLQDFPMDKIEIIVADGFSTDKTKSIAEAFKGRFGSLKVLDNLGNDPANGRNIGVKNSTAPYVLVLDGHTYIPSKNFLADIIETFNTTNADCLCRPQTLLPPDINEFEKSVALCRGSTLWHNPGSEIYAEFDGEVDPTSSGAMYCRSVFGKIGYFDKQFDALVDVDFNYRVKISGLKSYLSQKLTVFYYPCSSIQGLWKQMNRYGIERLKFVQNHKIFSPVQWFAGLAVLLFVAALILSFISTTVYELFKTVTAFYLLIVLIYSFMLGIKEKHLGCILYGILIFPTIHFGLGFGFLKVMFSSLKYKEFKDMKYVP